MTQENGAPLSQPESGPAGSPRDRRVYWLAVGAAVIGIASVFFVSAAPRNTDEAIYILMADAAADGRLNIDNGYDLYHAEELKYQAMRIGPVGLVPQYPSGYGFLVQPFYLLDGIRGLVLLNMLSFLLAMSVTYGLCGQFGASQRVSVAAALIFGFASFSIPYSYGVWPHLPAVACVSGSLLSIIAATQTESARKAGILAIGGGLLIGLGINVRVDTILLAPPVLLWLAAQRAHWGKAILFIVGMIPGLLFAAWLNYLKFGSFAPISYGSSGTGNTTVAGYWPLLLAALIAGIGALAFSAPQIRRLCTVRNLTLVAVLSIAVVLALEPLRGLLFRVITGFYVLVIDFQASQTGVWEDRAPGGHLLVAGMLKRALLQSLPWLGILPVSVLFWRKRKALLVLLGLVIVCWIAPFALTNWHGGGPNHMRYFLPILPPLSALAAMCFSRLWSHAEIKGGTGKRLILWIATMAGISTVVGTLGMANYNSLALSFAAWGSLIMAAAMAITTLAVTAQGSGTRVAARISMVLAMTALIWSSGSLLLYDFLSDRVIRNVNLTAIEAASTLDDGVLVIADRSVRFMPQLQRKNSYVAMPEFNFTTFDRGLVDYHLNAGRQVYVDGFISDRLLTILGAPRYETREVAFSDRVLVELTAPHD